MRQAVNTLQKKVEEEQARRENGEQDLKKYLESKVQAMSEKLQAEEKL